LILIIGEKMDPNERFFMKSCPTCLRDVPSFWDACVFCGNVFRKSEYQADEPAMLVFKRK